MDRPTLSARSLGRGAANAGKTAGAGAFRAGSELVAAVATLVDRAVDRTILSGERVTSAAEAKRRLAGDEDAEAHASEIQRVVLLSVPVVRRLVRGARVTRIPWVMVASSVVSVGIAVRTGLRELRVLSSLVAHRLEEATGRPPDPALVKKLAIELYLHPKRRPDVDGSGRGVVGLTRRWVVGGAFGRNTSKRAGKAFEAAERLDAGDLAVRWAERR
jgi:hypothetical protein